MVFKARHVYGGLAGNVADGGHGGACTEAAADPDDVHFGRAGPQVEIAKPINGDHLVSRSDRGLRKASSRHAGEVHARHDNPSRRRACSRATTSRRSNTLPRDPRIASRSPTASFAPPARPSARSAAP